MAYIHAENLDDVLMDQGFVTARDRLFQMQLTRLFLQGRICELAGMDSPELVNPHRRKGFGKTLLGSGSLPAGGSGETLNRGWCDHDKPFAVTHCAALRMIADLSDTEKVLAVLPGGVTGRTFHPGQKNQIEAFMSGEKMYWWFSDEAINQNQVS